MIFIINTEKHATIKILTTKKCKHLLKTRVKTVKIFRMQNGLTQKIMGSQVFKHNVYDNE